MDQRPPPEVTIRDPARPNRPVDVLAAGDDEPPAPPPTRLRFTAAGAVLVLVAGMTAAAGLRDAQRAAAEELRVASVVELRLDPDARASAAYDHETDTAVLELLLPVHNDGPRDVVVLSGGAGGYGLVRPVELRAGSRGLLQLEQTLDCSSLPESPAGLDVLELSVRTQAGPQPRRVLVPMPHAWDEYAPHPCRGVPLHELVSVDVLDIGWPPDALQVTLEMVNAWSSAITVMAVRAVDPGLEAKVEEPAGGPVRLLRHNGVGVVRVRIAITDCAAARSADGTLGLEVLVEDGRRAHALPQLDLDPSLRQTLVDRSC